MSTRPQNFTADPCQSGITHLDETIYKNPHQFDPDRFLPPRSEDDSEALSFLGWGVGNIVLPVVVPTCSHSPYENGRKASVPGHEVRQAGDEEHSGRASHLVQVPFGERERGAADAQPQQSPHYTAFRARFPRL